jgi:lipopolysaccharide export system protein LptA
LKAKDAGFLRQPVDLDSDTRSLRNEENGRPVSENLQQRQGETLSRKTVGLYQKTCSSGKARHSAEKRSYASHPYVEFNDFCVK